MLMRIIPNISLLATWLIRRIQQNVILENTKQYLAHAKKRLKTGTGDTVADLQSK